MTKCNNTSGHQQGNLFKVFLRDIVDPFHPVVRLAGQVNWKQFEDALAPVFADEEGRARCPGSTRTFSRGDVWIGWRSA